MSTTAPSWHSEAGWHSGSIFRGPQLPRATQHSCAEWSRPRGLARWRSKGLPAQGLDQALFLFFRQQCQCVERGEVTSHWYRGEQNERFTGKPVITGQISHEKNRCRNAAHQDLRAKRNQHSHAGLPLAAHLPELHLAWKRD